MALRIKSMDQVDNLLMDAIAPFEPPPEAFVDIDSLTIDDLHDLILENMEPDTQHSLDAITLLSSEYGNPEALAMRKELEIGCPLAFSDVVTNRYQLVELRSFFYHPPSSKG